MDVPAVAEVGFAATKTVEKEGDVVVAEVVMGLVGLVTGVVGGREDDGEEEEDEVEAIVVVDVGPEQGASTFMPAAAAH